MPLTNTTESIATDRTVEDSPKLVKSDAGNLEGRKVSNWQKVKEWCHRNRKTIALVFLIIGIATATFGAGLAAGAIASGAALSGKATFAWISILWGSSFKTIAVPKLTQAGILYVAGLIQVLVGGIIALKAGSCLYEYNKKPKQL